jgi:hypothetical protein
MIQVHQVFIENQAIQEINTFSVVNQREGFPGDQKMQEFEAFPVIQDPKGFQKNREFQGVDNY